MKIFQLVLYGLACVFLLTGGLLTGFWKQLFDCVLSLQLQLWNSTFSESYAVWNSNTVPLYFSIRMFNWTNPQLSLSKEEKPRFVELGPYTFRVNQFKDRIVWNENGTVSFRNRRRWDFVPKMSNGSLDDDVTNVNVVAVTFAHFSTSNVKFGAIGNDILKAKVRSLYVTKTVRELLFDGYSDELLELNAGIKDVFKEFQGFPDRFAWYWGKNLSQSEIFNMYTGKTDINELGMLHSWNYSTHGHFYRDDCDQVRGSPGDLWPMNMAEQRDASFFVSDLCSHFQLRNMGPKTVYNVDGVTFEGVADIFDNGTKFPEYSCYCPNNKCQIKSGVRNATRCLLAPAFVSYPHFYGADSYYLNSVDGLHPDPEKHKFTITLQQDSGLPLQLFIRLQINILLEPHEHLELFQNVPKVFLPGIWFEGFIDMPQHIQHKLSFSFNLIPKLMVGVGLTLVILGIMLLVCEIMITRRNKLSARITRTK